MLQRSVQFEFLLSKCNIYLIFTILLAVYCIVDNSIQTNTVFMYQQYVIICQRHIDHTLYDYYRYITLWTKIRIRTGRRTQRRFDSSVHIFKQRRLSKQPCSLNTKSILVTLNVISKTGSYKMFTYPFTKQDTPYLLFTSCPPSTGKYALIYAKVVFEFESSWLL